MDPLARDAGRVAVKAAVVWLVWHGLTWIKNRQEARS